MDTDLDTWFDKEKEKLSDEFSARIKQGKNLNIGQERVRFEKRFKKLCEDYNKKYDKGLKREELDKKMHEPIKKFYAFMDTMAEQFKEE